MKMCTDFRYSHEDLAIFGNLTPHVRVEIPVIMALNAFTTFERRKNTQDYVIKQLIYSLTLISCYLNLRKNHYTGKRQESLNACIPFI